MSRQQSPGGRRAPLPPSPLHDELVRARLLEALAARFDVPVTAVVAGAGFGKTTALAQAIRANDAAPRGIDAWVACEPGDEDAGRLSSAILSALGVASRGGSNIDRVLGALRAAAPVDVCVVIDDLHELPAMSAGEQLVRELTTRLPPHAHLVLASRGPVPIPLARRRAAGQVVEIGGEALAFTDAEVTALAGLLGEDHAACDGLAGWPSLVRLVLSAPPGATRQFLWEEIVAGLSPAERSGLLALAVLGSGSASEVALVAGREVDIDRLVGFVPLLHQDAHGHARGSPAVGGRGRADLPGGGGSRGTSTGPAPAPRARRDRSHGIGGCALGRPRHVPPGVRLARAREPRSAPHRHGRPAGWRARRRVRWTRRSTGCSVWPCVTRSIDITTTWTASSTRWRPASFERGDSAAQAVTLALGAVSAHARGDITRLVVLTERIRALPGVTQQPELQFFVDAVDAAYASLSGDVERSLRTIEAMSFDQVPPPVREIVIRLHATILVLAGRAEEAIPIGRSLLESPHAYVRSIPSMLRWLAGDPSDYLALPLSVEPPLGDHLFRFVAVAHCAGVAASLGDRALADLVRPEVDATIGQPLDARDSAIAATAVACCKILDHDEEAATSAIADHLARHPLARRRR